MLTKQTQSVHAILSVLLHSVKEAFWSPSVRPKHNRNCFSKLVQLEKKTLLNDTTITIISKVKSSEVELMTQMERKLSSKS